MAQESPYHPGEVEVQSRAGSRELAMRHGRLIDDRIMAGALAFIASRTMVLIGSTDHGGAVWASLVHGTEGLIEAEPRKVTVDLTHAIHTDDDPLWGNLVGDTRLGMLFIELATRRRVRVNGIARMPDARRIELQVEESYPNCTKFIHRRAPPEAAAPRHSGGSLALDDPDVLAPVVTRFAAEADTLFIATAHTERGVDVSHRGGPRGFVRVLDDGRLRVPDYTGNGMFNTLGNLAADPRAGLLVPDFERGDLLQITGRAEIRWDLPDAEGESGGTGRFWDFAPQRGLLLRGAMPAGWRRLAPERGDSIA